MTTAILLSGGMDSTAIAYWVKPELAITIDYGQAPAAGEIRAASAVCEALNIEHVIVSCDLSALGSGDLSGKPPDPSAPVSEWWPYRNQMLITLAGMVCIPRKINDLLIGALRTDDLHADGRKDFVVAMNTVLEIQEGHLNLRAPAIDLDAVELINKSGIPKELLAWAHSCHVAELACGFCRGCRKHYETNTKLGHGRY